MEKAICPGFRTEPRTSSRALEKFTRFRMSSEVLLHRKHREPFDSKKKKIVFF